jgi:hypothetical protein
VGCRGDSYCGCSAMRRRGAGERKVERSEVRCGRRLRRGRRQPEKCSICCVFHRRRHHAKVTEVACRGVSLDIRHVWVFMPRCDIGVMVCLHRMRYEVKRGSQQPAENKDGDQQRSVCFAGPRHAEGCGRKKDSSPMPSTTRTFLPRTYFVHIHTDQSPTATA